MAPDFSRTPLLKKLGIKEHFRCRFVKAPTVFFDLLGPLPDGVKMVEKDRELDYIHLFAASDEILEQHLQPLLTQLKPDGMLWVSWYKKASGIKTDLNGDIIRGTARNLGLIDAKVCSINEEWSALKFVIRKELR